MLMLYGLLCWACTCHSVYAGGCRMPLGMKDKSITDKQLSASSSDSLMSSAIHGRLDSTSGNGAWCPSQRNWYSDELSGPFFDQYYQVLFPKPVRIVAVGIQGRTKNFGQEGVDYFLVKYSKTTVSEWNWYKEWGHGGAKMFTGTKEKVGITKMNFFKPAIIADAFKFVPEIYRVNQVCLRMELYGCHLQQDLEFYSLHPGNVFNSIYNLTDLIFDGITNSTLLLKGQGFLTDGQFHSTNFLQRRGYGWIGWNAQQTISPFITFSFLKQRVFKSMTFHCHIQEKVGIKLFKSVMAFFSKNNQKAHNFVFHPTEAISAGNRAMNYNVTIDMCSNHGNEVTVKFAYEADWILISEVVFDSDPLLNELSPPAIKCQPTTLPPITEDPLISQTTTEPSATNITVIVPNKDARGDGLGDGVVIGIVCGVIVIIILLVGFLCYWCYCRRSDDQKKPSFYNFIRWELKPYNSYNRSPSNRVSRLGSNAEDTRNFTFRRDQNGDALADNDSAIYASIKNLQEVGNVPDHMVVKASKPGKPKNKPPPLPMNALPHQTADHYALPDSPLIPEQPAVDEDGYCSPEPNTPLIRSPLSAVPKTKKPPPESQDAFYAEPDAPSPKIGGYSEPIDAVIPGDGIFRNPVYEEIYSEPYQGVSGSTLYATPSTVVKHDAFKDLPRDKVVFKEKIGDGQFGEVHLGEVEGLGDILGKDNNNPNKRVLVAIKKLKPEVDKNIKEDFFKEVKIMSGIEHGNVIRLLGVCRDDPMCMIVEYMVNGDLNQFLKERQLSPGTNKEKILTYQALIYMASQVAAGMKYISSLKFVHRDLATRNCLVGHSYTVKIADFGMSRHLYSKHYYRVHGRVILPIRWMAPECILQGKFTSESDVWAYAVTLWEILTLATEYPYNEMTDEKVIENVQRMYFRPECPKIVYLSKPSVCPDDVYDMMRACWNRDPEARPDFSDLFGFVKSKVRMSEMAI